jgi:hypothetical protein
MADGWIKVATAAQVILVLEGAVALSAAGLWSLKGPTKAELASMCSANLTSFECSYTNASRVAVEGSCSTVALVPKRAGKPTSALLCSGTLGPRESKSVSSPFAGRAVDACHDAEGNLSWDDCNLTVTPFP